MAQNRGAYPEIWYETRAFLVQPRLSIATYLHRVSLSPFCSYLSSFSFATASCGVCVCVCVCVEPLLARCVCPLLRDHLMDIYTVYIYRGKEYASVNNQGFVFTASHRYTNNGIPRSGRVPLSRRVSLVEVSLWVVRKMIGNI